MAGRLEFNGLFKYLGTNSNTNAWKNGVVYLSQDGDKWHLESHLKANPVRIYRLHPLNTGEVVKVFIKAGRVIIDFINGQSFHFKNHTDGSCTVVKQLEEQLKVIVAKYVFKSKGEVKNRAEVSNSLFSPNKPVLSRRSVSPSQRSPRPVSVLDSSPARSSVLVVNGRTPAMIVKSSPLEQRVPELPSPELSPSPATSPLRFTSVKENKRSRQEVNETSPDDESKENQHRGLWCPESNQASRRGDRQPLKVASSSFYGSLSATPSHLKPIKRYGGLSAPTVTRKRLSSDVSYSWNRTSTPSLSAKPNTPALQGFANIGNTCYMNAILQSLFSLDTLVIDLTTLQKHHGKALSSSSLAYALARLLCMRRRPQTESQKLDLLRGVKRAISSTAKRFSGSQQHDAHEFLGQVLDQLKEEVLKVLKDINAAMENGGGAVFEVSSPSRDVMLSPLPSGENGLLVEVTGKLTGTSPVLNPTTLNFEFEVVHTIECLNCQEHLQKAEQFNDLSVDIPPTRLPGVPLTLQDALDVFLEKEQIEYTCGKCQHKKAQVSHRFTKQPRVLVLHLKRYTFDAVSSNNSKMRQNVQIPRFVTLRDHCDQQTQPHAPTYCITHKSPSSSAPRRRRLSFFGERNGEVSPTSKVPRLLDDLDASGEDLDPKRKTSTGNATYEEELELAIQLSKNEPAPKPIENVGAVDLTEDEDEQLKQALALSLRELESDHVYTNSNDDNNNDGDNVEAVGWMQDQETTNISDIAESDLMNMTMEEQIRLAINRSLAQSSPPNRSLGQSSPPRRRSHRPLSPPSPTPPEDQNMENDRQSQSCPPSIFGMSGHSVGKTKAGRDRLRTTWDSFKKPSSHTRAGYLRETRQERNKRLKDKGDKVATAEPGEDAPTGDKFLINNLWEEHDADWLPETARIPEDRAQSDMTEMDMEIDRDEFSTLSSIARVDGLQSSRQSKVLDDEGDAGFTYDAATSLSKSSCDTSGSANLTDNSSDAVSVVPASKTHSTIDAGREGTRFSKDSSEVFSYKSHSSNSASAQGVRVGSVGCISKCLTVKAANVMRDVEEEESDGSLPEVRFDSSADSVQARVSDMTKTKRVVENGVSDKANKSGKDSATDAVGFTWDGDEDWIYDVDEIPKPAVAPNWSENETTPDKKEPKSGTEEKENQSPAVVKGGNQQPALVDKQLEAKIAQHMARATEVEKGNVPFSYRLVSVVNHLGASSNTGHYISDVFDMRKQAWFSYNDSNVLRTSEMEVRTSRVRSGYIFFYLSKEIYDEFCSKVPKGNEVVSRS